MGAACIGHIKQCSIIFVLCKVIMESLLDYWNTHVFLFNYSLNLAMFFLTKVNYSLRLLKFE